MSDLLSLLLAAPNLSAQRKLVDVNREQLDDELVAHLKEEATQILRADVQRSMELADLLAYIAECTGSLLHRALGLLARANALSLGGLGEYQAALACYDEASAIYRAEGRPVEEATAQIARILALANLGRYQEALDAGRDAAEVLRQHDRPLLLGKITTNMGLIYHRLGEDAQALDMFDLARDSYGRQPDDAEALKATGRVENNRSSVLRNLGRFQESMMASDVALEILAATGQSAEAARTRQNLAITLFILGRYNDALELLDQAQAFFLADGRQRDVILVELFMSDCLLQLHRFGDVLDKTRQVRNLFSTYGTSFEVAQALLNEATAYTGLGRHDEALAALERARQVFEIEGNRTWVASTDMEMAVVMQRLGRHAESLQRVQVASATLQERGLAVEEARARLIAARAALALGDLSQARELVNTALAVGAQYDLPSLLFPCEHLLGQLSERDEDLPGALEHYTLAIGELERLRHRLMIEHRVDFLENRAVVYEDAVAVCLALDLPHRGLQLAEQAKSRALLELLDLRLELGVEARTPEDQPLVDELKRLKAERDQVYRRWEGGRELRVRGWTSPDGHQHQVQQQVVALEKRVTELWHKLLIRNAGYASDALLWQMRTEPVQPYLSETTLLLEYFQVRGQLVVFAVTCDTIRACRLPADLDQVHQLMQRLQLNLRAAAGREPSVAVALLPNAIGLLQKLHSMLLAPLQASACGHLLEHYSQLVVVPHGRLHYLPFQALHDGEQFLTERYEISVLPGASLLRHIATPRTQHGPSLAVGYSYEGALPHAPAEARVVAALLKGDALVEQQTTSQRLRVAGGQARVLHLATHGEFRADNPLFSGLALADGWLTTLDIFGLRLHASLVTLSACQTGRSVLGGGDELLGLARAFLSAGASSLLLSLWAVEDRSTAEFMEAFYGKLAQGATKSEALRHAQKQFIASGDSGSGYPAAYAHPYYWAPFVLMGHTGPL